MNLIKTTILALSMGAAMAATAASQPKYIFYCIGDGMGAASVINAQLYARQILGDTTGLAMTSMPVASMSTTHSSSSDVTNSSAAGTALASGHKTKNDMLGMNPDTVAVTSMAKVLFDNGWGIGLVTSVAIDDATPAAFYAHQPNRHMYHPIGLELARSGYQFAAGAGLRGLIDKKTGKPTGLLDEFAANNMRVVYGTDSISGTEERLLLLSPDTDRPWNIGYTIDSIAGALTLQGLTQAGITHLERVSPDRFFMMVEGGNIDHAGHANDGATNIIETINFDKTIGLICDFCRKHPHETLIVVTADHETGGMTVGNNTTGYATNLKSISGQRVSKEAFSNYCMNIIRSRRVYMWDDMHDYLAENMGFWNQTKLTDAETEELKNLFEQIFVKRQDMPSQETLYADFNAFAAKVFAIANDKAGIGWASEKHTGVTVPVFAAGVGAEKFSRMLDNTDIPRTIMEIAGYSLP
ncbi:MAG: alkaline phosphatase [Muribaculaceae bacterium]|nr:alkaline phosphatase [Muribaculaceae bacterium]